MLQVKVLRSEISTINGLEQSISNITTLGSETFDNLAEMAKFVVKLIAILAHALFTGAKRSKILNCRRNRVTEQPEGYPTDHGAIDLHIKEHFMCDSINSVRVYWIN